jgi:protoporphyrinogen oxidase
MQTTWRVAVIGGGISGLAAAHRLQELCAAAERPLDLTLFEAGPRLGGVVATRKIAGYQVELGADSFITNKPWAVDLCRRLGIEDRLIPTETQYRRSLVLRRGRPLPVPDGFQLLAPVDDVYTKLGDAQGGWYESIATSSDTTAISGARNGVPFGASPNPPMTWSPSMGRCS